MFNCMNFLALINLGPYREIGRGSKKGEGRIRKEK
jgi:hypothetical protein